MESHGYVSFFGTHYFERCLTMGFPMPLIFLAGIAWVLLVFVNYTANHSINPDVLAGTMIVPLTTFTLEGFLSLAVSAAKAGTLLVGMVLTAFSAGSCVCRWIDARYSERIRDTGQAGEYILLSVLVGFGVLTFLVFGSGLCGFYSVRSYLLLVFLSLVSGAGQMKRLVAICRGRFAKWPDGGWQMADGGWLLPTLLALFLVLLGSLIAGLAPPHILDELRAHLGNVRWYMWHEKIVPQAGNSFSFRPQASSMLYGLSVALGIDYSAKWLHWLAGLVAIGGLAMLTRGIKPVFRILGIITFCTIPSIWTHAARAYSDLFLCAYATVAYALLFQDRKIIGDSGKIKALFAGILMGLATGHKYTGILLGLSLLPLLSRGNVAYAVSGFVAVVAPWSLMSLFQTGNPCYPLLYTVFGGLGWDDVLSGRLQNILYRENHTIWQRLAGYFNLPWSVTIGNAGSYADGVTGVLLAGGYVLLLVRLRSREMLALALYLLPCAYFWSGARLFIPVIPLMIAVALRSLHDLSPRMTWRWGGKALVILLVWYQAMEYFQVSWGKYDDPLPFLLGNESRVHYLDRKSCPRLYYPVGYSSIGAEIPGKASERSRVMFLGGYGGAYAIPGPAYYTSEEGRPLPVEWSAEAMTVDRMASRMRQAGVGYVLVNRWGNEPFYDYWMIWDWKSPRDLMVWRDYWERHAVLLWEKGYFSLYKMSDESVAQSHRVLPGYEDENVRLAMRLLYQDQMHDARNILSMMSRIVPDSPGLMMAKTKYYMANDETGKALVMRDRLAGAEPGSVYLRRCDAWFKISAGRMDDGISLVRAIISMEPDSPMVWLDLAMVYKRQNRLEEARLAEAEQQKTDEAFLDR